MKAVIGTLTPAVDSWAAELKWDGMRLQLRVEPGGSISAFSGSGRDVTSMAPELHSMNQSTPISCVLDGELVSFEGDRPSFARLQHRIHVADPAPHLLNEFPVVFLAFDVLSADGQATTALPYTSRRQLLGQILDDGPAWRTPPHGIATGNELLTFATQHELEGIVLKRPDSPYRPGQRSPDWVKIKLRNRHEFVVGGWMDGKGGLDGQIGSLLVGTYDDDGQFRYAGTVGSGLGDDDRSRLAELLTSADNPFTDSSPRWSGAPHFVAPSVVVEVEFSLWAADGVLWHPVYRGLRTDRRPQEVRREFPPTAEAP